ncbi:threonine/serine exporter [Neobacillus notoginsengisoli]|uniref:Threonine/serine exporter n=1 Tax=Neobacillus notoginsengisoli TaxID=1578198 RepID=A0A417YVR9_9BACI|nr:threonine/serine exporter family protein [Neobacillus notoginsengisoli]RHW41490.1 threonine/serine exporter [Neobacillus notoginsengisoli]
MENQRREVYDVMKVCLNAGKIMLQNGAETYRVEDTMTRMASSFGIEASHSYVIPTGIIFTAEDGGPGVTKLIRISHRSTDLQKVALVNSISRRISEGDITLEQAVELLDDIDKMSHTFPLSMQTAAASLASACFMIMYKGSWIDFIPALFAGGLGFLTVTYLQRIVPIKFFAEFCGALIIGLVALIFVLIGWGDQLDKIIIGSVMPLVPGLLLTNAVRDLIAGHLVAGLSKGAEATLTAIAIGSGVAIVLALL